MKDLILKLIAPKPTSAGPTTVPGITLYGDSIMAGGIAQCIAASGYEGLLRDRSVPGDTAANAWRRMPYELRITTHVVLQHGTNDLTGGNDPVGHLRDMTRRMKAEGRIVILTGLSQRADKTVASVNLEILRLAMDEGVAFADWGQEYPETVDGLHPTKAMTEALAKRLLETLERPT